MCADSITNNEEEKKKQNIYMHINVLRVGGIGDVRKTFGEKNCKVEEKHTHDTRTLRLID